MSASSASGGASALKGRPWIIVSAARSRCRSSAMATVGLLGLLVVGVLEGWVAVFVKGTDAFHPVGMDCRAPVGFHHDRDGLLGRLTLAQPDGPFHRLNRGRRVARDRLGDPASGIYQRGLRMHLVDHPE